MEAAFWRIKEVINVLIGKSSQDEAYLNVQFVFDWEIWREMEKWLRLNAG